MRTLSLVVLFITSTIVLYAQSNCAKFRNGKFKTTYKGLTVFIKRNGNFQYEYMPQAKVSVSYTINWINDCTYTLKPNEDLFKRFPNTPKNALVIVKIISTGANSYRQTSTSNFNKLILTTEVIKI